MDCYNTNCPFRDNTSSSGTRCDCIACPNRSDSASWFASNRTLTKEEIGPIIRCKQCVSYKLSEIPNTKYYYCSDWNIITSDDDFCSRGEYKNEYEGL